MASIQGIYIALFGRPADPLGLEFFNEATGNGADLTAIGDLSSTDEYQSRFEGKDNASIVTDIYQSLFGRNPEQAGLAFFVNALNSGTLNINNVAIAILDGAQGDDLATVNNKITAADAFTAAIDTPDELAAYRGDTAAGLGRDFLSAITADEATIPTAAQVDAAVANVVTNGNPGDAFALTVGQDTLVGTNLADVFTAAAVSATGAAVTTLNAGDSVDGGAGVDTLKITATATNNNALVGTIKNVEIIEIKGSDFISGVANATEQAAIDTAAAALAAAKAAALTANTASDTADAKATVVSASKTAIDGEVAGAVDPASTNDAAVQAVINEINSATAADAATKAAAIAAVNALDPSDAATYPTTGDMLAAAKTAATTATADAVTAANTAAANADLAADTANQVVTNKQTDYNNAVNAVAGAGVDASFFAGSTDISVDGKATKVIDVTSQTIHFTAGGAVTNSVSYDDDVKASKIVLADVAGTITVAGADLESLSVSGTVHAANSTTPGDLDLVGPATVTALTLSVSSAALLDVSALTGLETIDASGSTGALGKATGGNAVDLTNLADLVSYKGSQGADVIIVGQDGTINRVIETGAGNDRVSIDGDNLGAALKGTLSVDLGTGVDRVNIIDGVANITVNTESKFLDGAIKVAGFGADDVLSVDGANLNVAHARAIITADVQAEISAADSLFDAVGLAAAETVHNEYATFTYGGNTYIYVDNAGDGTVDVGDGLVEITGFTGALTDTNFIA